MKSYLHTKISKIEEVAPGYALLQFQSKEPLIGEPGQFVMIRGNWGQNPVLPRAFSIVQAGNNGQVLVRDVGPGTSLLCNMQPGDDLFVLGPLGNKYEAPAQGQTAVLVAGGVGVAPLYFLATQLKKQNIEVTFLYGGRTANDLPLSDHIKSIANLIITTEDGSIGQKGLITQPLFDTLKNGNATVYSCGPHGMLEAVTNVATSAGVKSQVALESPMACGMGTCKGCAVVLPDGSFKYVCSDGPVFDGETIFGGSK